MSASGQELAIVQSAATAVASVAKTTSLVISQIRTDGLVRAEERERLRLRLVAMKYADIAGHLKELAAINIDHVCELYELAESRATSPQQYVAALRIAAQAARNLETNLNELARKLR
jgi:hypothetical protein